MIQPHRITKIYCADVQSSSLVLDSYDLKNHRIQEPHAWRCDSVSYSYLDSGVATRFGAMLIYLSNSKNISSSPVLVKI